MKQTWVESSLELRNVPIVLVVSISMFVAICRDFIPLCGCSGSFHGLYFLHWGPLFNEIWNKKCHSYKLRKPRHLTNQRYSLWRIWSWMTLVRMNIKIYLHGQGGTLWRHRAWNYQKYTLHYIWVQKDHWTVYKAGNLVGLVLQHNSSVANAEKKWGLVV